MAATEAAAITAARKAGQLMLRFQERLDQRTVTRKDADELVSDADRMAEEIIIETSDGVIRVIVDRAKKRTARIGVDAPAVCKIWRKEVLRLL